MTRVRVVLRLGVHSALWAAHRWPGGPELRCTRSRSKCCVISVSPGPCDRFLSSLVIHGVLDGWAGALAKCGPTPGRGVGHPTRTSGRVC